jgi:hypothetical protein
MERWVVGIRSLFFASHRPPFVLEDIRTLLLSSLEVQYKDNQ